jgi:hypothetical protein
MKKLFTHENRIIVFNLKNVLQAEGIETVVVNEFAAGGAGDLATFDTWPELWVEDNGKLEQAQAIIQGILDSRASSDWVCRTCLEQNDASFQFCWNCGQTLE